MRPNARDYRRCVLSERFERSSWGRNVISALIAVLVLVEIGTNLPASALQRAVGEASGQTARALASEQVWGVFAPDPRGSSLKLEARITFVDGTTATWEVPTGAPIGTNLRYYRWRKWLERVRSDEYSNLWDPTARWIASLYDDRPSPVARVELIRGFRENVVRGEQPPYQHFTYFTLDLEPTR